MVSAEILAQLALDAAFAMNQASELEKSEVCYDLQGNTWVVQRNLGNVVYAYNLNDEGNGHYMDIKDLRLTSHFDHSLEVLSGRIKPDVIFDKEAAFASALALTAEDPSCLGPGSHVVIGLNDPHIYTIVKETWDGKLIVNRQEESKSGRHELRNISVTVKKDDTANFQNLFHAMLLHSSADLNMANSAQDIMRLLAQQ